ncbi:MAG: ABC transporter permease subunit [Clostridiales bacterium]|nr:ABC transporter permease subunit [Clostridiales bacterium]
MRGAALRKTIIVLIWLVLWQVASLLVHNNILLAGPVEAIKALIRLGVTADFWLSVLYTLLKITLGFLIGVITGIIFAFLSYRFRLFRDIVTPPITVIKSIPVASFVILVIIWAGASSLSSVISTLVVFPMIYFNVLSGLDSTDSKLIELGTLFKFRLKDKLSHIFLPSVAPHLRSAIAVCSGMAFKSGIAAEVIGRPLHAIGTGVYLSKISLATDELFAWTFCAVVLAYLFEKLVSLVLRRLLPS